MCTDHRLHAVSRRGFTVMALGACLVPYGALGAGTVLDALCVMCIDYRLADSGVYFFDGMPGRQKYDVVALAGASLAGSSTGLFSPTVAGFWQQVDAARLLHKIRKIIVLDHMECGAFKEEFSPNEPLPRDRERFLHEQSMAALKRTFDTRAWPYGKPENGIAFYIAEPPVPPRPDVTLQVTPPPTITEVPIR